VQAKFSDGSSILGLSQLILLPQLPLKTILKMSKSATKLSSRFVNLNQRFSTNGSRRGLNHFLVRITELIEIGQTFWKISFSKISSKYKGLLYSVFFV